MKWRQRALKQFKVSVSSGNSHLKWMNHSWPMTSPMIFISFTKSWRVWVKNFDNFCWKLFRIFEFLRYTTFQKNDDEHRNFELKKEQKLMFRVTKLFQFSHLMKSRSRREILFDTRKSTPHIQQVGCCEKHVWVGKSVGKWKWVNRYRFLDVWSFSHETLMFVWYHTTEMW